MEKIYILPKGVTRNDLLQYCGIQDDDDRIHYLSYGSERLNLLQAINKQIEELR